MTYLNLPVPSSKKRNRPAAGLPRAAAAPPRLAMVFSSPFRNALRRHDLHVDTQTPSPQATSPTSTVPFRRRSRPPLAVLPPQDHVRPRTFPHQSTRRRRRALARVKTSIATTSHHVHCAERTPPPTRYLRRLPASPSLWPHATSRSPSPRSRRRPAISSSPPSAPTAAPPARCR